MGRYYPESWKKLFDQKEEALLANDCYDAIGITSLDELQRSLHTTAQEYGEAGFPDIITRLQPGFHYLESFNTAITSASQYDPRACLVWGILQAFVQSACQSQVILNDMLGLINELNEALPEFGAYLVMFPESPALQAHLQDIYDTYMEYCIASIRYMKKRPTLYFIKYFFGADPATSLKRTKDEIKKHMRLFERTAKLSVRQQTVMQNIGTELSAAPLTEFAQDTADKTKDEVEFPINTVSMIRNFTFLGRSKELEDMKTALRTTLPATETTGEAAKQSRYGQGVPCCTLQGLGGIGKTQAALEFTYKYREDYDAIFWVGAEIDSSIAAAFAGIAKQLGLMNNIGGDEGENQGQAIERSKKWLANTTRKWLLVFDNVEDISDVAGYLPQTVRSHSAVILTTQKGDFFPITENFTTINIKDLTRDQGAELLYACLRRDASDDDEREYAKKISDLLGGLPLALTTIGGYIHQTGDTISSFFNYLKTSCNAWDVSAIGPAKQYERTLATVFEIALKELPDHARNLIDILAFLNPDQIPEGLFMRRIGDPEYPFLSNKPKFSDTIRSLRNRQLVGRDTSTSLQYLTIHRTVQLAVLHDLSRKPETRRTAYEQAFSLVQQAMPKVSSIDNPEPGLWPEFQKYVPHILTLRAHCLWPEPPMELSLEFAQVLSDMATFMWHAGLLSDGIDAMRTAEHILQVHQVGIENPLRGNIIQHISIFASHSGVSLRDEAMSRRHEAIKARAASHRLIEYQGKVTREDEIRLWNVESDMAFGLLQCEEFAKAGVIIEKCRDQYLQWGDSDAIPFEYLKYNHIISYTYMAEGNALESIRACKEGARLGEVCCGVMHPMTLHVRCSLANHLFFAGMIDESLKENLIVLQGRINMMGEFNHFTLESHSMCGSLFAKMDDLEQAEYHFLTCLDPIKRSAWDEEGIARAHFLYSDVLRRFGRDEEAESHLKQARTTRDEFLVRYPQWLQEDSNDELVVFDQMVCLWAGRYTGKLKHTPESLNRGLDALQLTASEEPPNISLSTRATF